MGTGGGRGSWTEGFVQLDVVEFLQSDRTDFDTPRDLSEETEQERH